MESELVDQLENWVTLNFVRDILVSLPLISDMDEPMIDPHLELGRGGITFPFIRVELDETK